MLVLAPFGELREVFEHLSAIGMEDVRTVPVHQYPVLVVVIECIPSYVGTAVHQQHGVTQHFRQTLGDDAACETRPNNQVVEHSIPPSCVFPRTLAACSFLPSPM